MMNWEGIVDDDDKPISCNEKMKQYMFDHWALFRDFVSDALHLLQTLPEAATQPERAQLTG